MKMRVVIGFLLIATFWLSVPAQVAAGWDVNIMIPLPGHFYYYGYYGAPLVAPHPGAYRYGAAVAVPLFSGGLWYLPFGGRWYISAQYAGPWSLVAVESVPMELLQVPILHEGGRGAEGRYRAPRLYYEGGRRGHEHGHDND